MAVIVSNGAGNLSDANRFLRSDSYEMGINYNNVVASVATTGTQSQIITFANTGKCKGVLIPFWTLYGSATANLDRGIRLDLEESKGTTTISIASPAVITKTSHGLSEGQQIRFTTTGVLPTGLTVGVIYYVRYIDANTFNVSTTPTGSFVNTSGTQSGTHTLWAIRDSKSKTASELNPEYGHPVSYYDAWIGWVNFEFDDGGYTISTSSNGWRIVLWIDSGTLGTYYWVTCDNTVGTAKSYITYSDNAVSFSSGNDCVWCKDVINIDMNATFKDYLSGSGVATESYCGGVTMGGSLDKEGMCNLVCDSPASSYTFKLQGYFQISSYGGVRFGSSTSRIQFANQLNIDVASPTVGTGTNSGFFSLYRRTSSAYFRGKNSVLFYGEIPSKRYGVLAQDANISQNQIVLTEDMTGIWNIGDYLCIGKMDHNGSVTTTSTWHQISSISGTTITLSTNLESYKRLAGALVINRNNYGIRIFKSGTANYANINVGTSSHFEMSGVENYLTTITFVNGTSYTFGYSQPTNSSKWNIENNCFWTDSVSYYLAITSGAISPPKGVNLSNNTSNRYALCYGLGGINNRVFKSGIWEIKDNKCIAWYNVGINYNTGLSTAKIDVQNNTFQNFAMGQGLIYVGTAGSVCKNNNIWGYNAVTTTLGTIILSSGINCEISGNTYNKCSIVYNVSNGTAINYKIENEILGDEYANTTDIVLGGNPGWYTDCVFKNCGTLSVIDETYLSDMASGSKVRIVNKNSVENVDAVYTPLGTFTRCGDGLSDTTVRTSGAGKFSLRFAPNSSTDLLEWCQDFPIGDCKDKTFIASVWVKINSENYWAGEHQMPRLTAVYDDGLSEVYAEAAKIAGEWQLLFIPIVPTTTFGQVELCVNGSTDALDSDAYFYIDDYSCQLPPGVQVNLGGLDLWADGFPITPTISTNLNASDVWAYKKAVAQEVSESMGEYIGKKILNVSKFLGLK